MNPQFTYPLAPQGVDEHIFDTTPAFRSGVLKTTASIILFVVTYIILLVLAIGLAILCGYLGIALMSVYINIITLMFGLGLIGLGLMVIYFLLKFVFTGSKIDTSAFIEITEADQPQLFEFVRKISQETKAPFPKKIYLSDDVNACVFYDSSFWSMFFPIKKNLRIGLGLVNVINLSELKAVIAHEFGHFSQRSMTFGVYVYNVNNVIYKMLYDNQSYTDVLNKWASFSKYFYLFAVLTGRIIGGVQYVLRQVYIVINKAYSSLSIEMEYNADAVSAFVTGSDHLVTSLKKLNIGQVCYNNVLNYCNSNVPANLRSANFYPQQRILLKRFAEDHRIPVVNDDLQLPDDNAVFTNQSRITVKDQWASHPSVADRESRLKTLNLKTDVVTDSAWVLFTDAEQVQADMTDLLYRNVNFKAQPQMIDLQTFADEFNDKLASGRFNAEYKDYYDGREIGPFVVEDVIKTDNGNYTFDGLFTDANCKLAAKIANLKTDIDTLTTISNRANNLKTFDFDGIKYSYKDALDVQAQLQAEVKAAEEQLRNLDKKIFAFFYHGAASTEKQAQLEKLYRDMFNVQDQTANDLKLYNEVMSAMEPIYGEKRFNEIRLILQDVSFAEGKIIPRLKEVLEQATDLGLTEYQTECINAYLLSNKIYFMKPNFDNVAIGMFNKAMNAFASAMVDRSFVIKKNLLTAQLKTNTIYP